MQSGAVPWLAWRARLAARGDEPDAALRLDEAMLTLAAELARVPRASARQRPRWLTDVLERFDVRFADRTSLTETARSVGVRPEYLIRTFQRFVGCSPGEYVRKRRVEQARRALEGSPKQLSRIALDCGFADQAHFTRTSRDLGSAAAERLHERGAVVAVNVRYAARAEAVARAIGSLPLDLSGAPRAATARALCKRYGASDP